MPKTERGPDRDRGLGEVSVSLGFGWGTWSYPVERIHSADASGTRLTVYTFNGGMDGRWCADKETARRAEATIRRVLARRNARWAAEPDVTAVLPSGEVARFKPRHLVSASVVPVTTWWLFRFFTSFQVRVLWITGKVDAVPCRSLHEAAEFVRALYDSVVPIKKD